MEICFKNINGQKIIIGSIEKPMCNEERQKILDKWIEIRIRPYCFVKQFNKNMDIKRISIIASKELGFPVGTYDLKIKLAEHNIEGKYYHHLINCYYKISSRIIKSSTLFC